MITHQQPKKFANNTLPADGAFDYGAMLSELKERFARHIWFLGARNTKGTPRYQFEVDFCYALNELEQCPPYLRGKLFDRPNNVINKLVNYIKTLEPHQRRAPETA